MSQTIAWCRKNLHAFGDKGIRSEGFSVKVKEAHREEKRSRQELGFSHTERKRLSFFYYKGMNKDITD